MRHGVRGEGDAPTEGHRGGAGSRSPLRASCSTAPAGGGVWAGWPPSPGWPSRGDSGSPPHPGVQGTGAPSVRPLDSHRTVRTSRGDLPQGQPASTPWPVVAPSCPPGGRVIAAPVRPQAEAPSACGLRRTRASRRRRVVLSEARWGARVGSPSWGLTVASPESARSRVPRRVRPVRSLRSEPGSHLKRVSVAAMASAACPTGAQVRSPRRAPILGLGSVRGLRVWPVPDSPQPRRCIP